MLIVQVVKWRWGKRARAAEGGQARAVLPRAFALPETREGAVLLQEIVCDEEQGYAPVSKARHLVQVPRRLEVLQITSRGQDCYAIGILGSMPSGLPRRPPIPHVVELRAGSYWRLVMNARISGTGGQWYEEHTFNVTCGDTVPPHVFLNREPDKTTTLRAHLF